MLRLLPTKQELTRMTPAYALAAACVGLLLLRPSTGEVYTVEMTKFVKQIEVKEVVKYVEVERTDSRRVEVTKPDGTRIVSISNSQISGRESTITEERKETEVKEERIDTRVQQRLAKYSLGLHYDSNRNVGVSGGARLGDLPLFLELYIVPRTMYASLGIKLEI